MRIAFAVSAALMAAPALAQSGGPPSAPPAPPAAPAPVLPQIATTHAQIAQRLAQRVNGSEDGDQSAGEARVAAAAKSTEAAIADDPIVRDMVRQDPTLPPSLGGAASPRPRPVPGQSPP